MAPKDALTADGYDMTFGTNVVGWLTYDPSQPKQGYTDTPMYRTVLLHGIAHPRVM